MRGPEMVALLDRVDRLERESCALAERLAREAHSAVAWRGFLILLALAAAFTPFAARQVIEGTRAEVSARQFTLRDREDRMRAALYMDKETSPILSMYDEKGRNVLQVLAWEDGSAGLNVLDRDGVVRLSVGGFENGSRGVNLISGDRKKVAFFGANDVGKTSGMNIYGPPGSPRVAVGVQSDGSAGLAVTEKDGKISFTTAHP